MDSGMVDERILIVAPSGDDASLASRILGDDGFEVVAVSDLSELAGEAASGAGVIVLACEALADSEGCTRLRELIEHQESWSEVPILLIDAPSDDGLSRALDVLGADANVAILPRPLTIATFVTTTHAALRSRRRQYEVRQLLSDLNDAAAALERAHEQANRAKDEFITTVAHELRSPMAAIRGWSQLLRAGELENSDARSALAMIDASTDVQSRIIDDLMDLSRIVTGKVMMEPEFVDIVPVMQNVIATYEPAAQREGVHLYAEIPPEEMVIWGDPVRLQQIVWNLLSNALKFTPRDGSVRLTLCRDGDSAVLRVSDTGRGIPPELLPQVFERYRQAETGRRYRDGLGLGLAIAKHLVEQHGGSIQVFSEGRDRGAEFVVRLPLPPNGGQPRS